MSDSGGKLIVECTDSPTKNSEQLVLPPIRGSVSNISTVSLSDNQQSRPSVSLMVAQESEEIHADNKEKQQKRSRQTPLKQNAKIYPSTKLEDGIDEETDDLWKKKYHKRWCFIMGVVALIAIIICAIFLIIIIVLSATKTMTEKRLSSPETQSYPSSLKLSTPFDSRLLDSESVEYHTISEEICSQIEQAYAGSVISNSYQGCFVTSFSNGSTNVNYTIVSTPYPNKKADETMEYLLTSILEEEGEEIIEDFVPGSVTVTTTGEADATDMELVDAMERDENCDSSPCTNNGTCLDGLDSFFCVCAAGYSGRTCGVDLPECRNTTCSSHGLCVEEVGPGASCLCDAGYAGSDCSIDVDDCSPDPCVHGTCTDGVDNFTCSCDTGYEGFTCGIDTDECSSSPCASTGTCQDQVDGFICLCAAGYDGTLCNNNIDDCSTNPCVRGNCSDEVDGFSCTCDLGYEGDTCGLDTDECSSSPCASTGTCQDQVDGFICLCAAGYDGTLCNNNIDDCSTNPCVRGNCSDEVDSFSCTCDLGYEGDTCGLDTDECSSSPCASTGTCQDQVDGFICLCAAGYDGPLCNNNIDDCSTNPCVHGNCSDEVDGFLCTCDSGYEGYTCSIDTDECSANPCASTDTCEDQVHGFLCLCESGYEGTLCDQDVDDCASEPCVHCDCTDHGADNFTCSCHTGYEGKRCGIDTDECSANPCASTGTCDDQVHGFLCLCESGYEGTLCDQDVDDCASEPCVHGDCTDHGADNFTCSCQTGYEGERCGIDIDDCEADPCNLADGFGNGGCIDLVDGYLCDCAHGWTGDNCTIGIDECASDPCPADLSNECVDLVNGYRCVCKPGYIGSSCEEVDYCCVNLTVVTIPEQIATFYSYGASAGDSTHAQGDDGCPGSYNIDISIFGNTKSVVHICYNGLVSLDGEVGGFNSAPFPLTSGIAVIAAYWTDLDIRGGANIYSRVTDASCELDRAAAEVNVVYGTSFAPTRALIVTWETATTWSYESNTETVTLQLVLVTDDIDSYVMYIYGDMQWGITPQVGFDAGDGVNYFAVEGSRTDAMIEIETTSNIEVTGKYMFLISSANITAPEPVVCGDPCYGNGACTSNAASEDYTCSCFNGYSGDNCATGAGTC